MPDLSYDQIDALVDVDPIALRDVAWKLTQDVARLEAERDEALRLIDAHRAMTITANAALRDQLLVALGGDDDGKTPLGGYVAQLIAERDASIELLDQLTDDDPCDYDHHDYCQTHGLHSRPCANARAIALIAAVDQTAPSSPLETPQTADAGEAGVVEGAGGSEAAEADERPEPVAFVEDCLGVTLTPWQRDLLVSKSESTDA